MTAAIVPLCQVYWTLTATQLSSLLQLAQTVPVTAGARSPQSLSYAATSTKKLNFLGPDQEQLPYPLWDPEIWSNPRQLGPAHMHRLVYVATDQHNQQQMLKFTKQYGWDVHRAWAAADLAVVISQSGCCWQMATRADGVSALKSWLANHALSHAASLRTSEVCPCKLGSWACPDA